jgi:hypothetical protein
MTKRSQKPETQNCSVFERGPGYDSPELFREDLWLRRLAHSRNPRAITDCSIQAERLQSQDGRESRKRTSRILAQHVNARYQN